MENKDMALILSVDYCSHTLRKKRLGLNWA